MKRRQRKITFKNVDEMLVFIRDMNRRSEDAIKKLDRKIIPEEKVYDAQCEDLRKEQEDFEKSQLNERRLKQSLKDHKKFYQMQSKVNKYFLDYIKKNKIN